MGVRYNQILRMQQRRYDNFWDDRFMKTTVVRGFSTNWRRKKRRCWREWEPGNTPMKIIVNWSYLPIYIRVANLWRPVMGRGAIVAEMDSYDSWYCKRFNWKQVTRKHYNEIMKRVSGAVGV